MPVGSLIRPAFSFEKYTKQKNNGVPKGSRTPVAGMKTRCPRPLDDGDTLVATSSFQALLQRGESVRWNPS